MVTPQFAWGGDDLEWTVQFGTEKNERVRGVAVDPEGNIYVAGDTDGVFPGQSGGGLDGFLRKYNFHGEELWTKQFSSSNSGSEIIRAIAVDDLGNSFVVGGTSGVFPGQIKADRWDGFVRKFDPSGNERWTRQFGTEKNDRVRGVAFDIEGNIYLVGTTGGSFPGQVSQYNVDVFVRKYDQAGDEQWTRQFGTDGDDKAVDIAIDGGSNIIVLGQTAGTLPGQSAVGLEEPNKGGFDVFARKYNRDGDEQWTRQFGTEGSDDPGGVFVDNAGNTYVVGETDKSFRGQTSSGETDAFLSKLNSDGVDQWTRQFGTENIDLAVDVSNGGDGNIIVAGYTSGNFFADSAVTVDRASTTGDFDAFLIKFDSGGESFWARQFGTDGNDRVRGLASDKMGGFYVIGDTDGVFQGQTSSGETDGFIVKVQRKDETPLTKLPSRPLLLVVSALIILLLVGVCLVRRKSKTRTKEI
jgi:hypothetical protein